MKKPQIAFFINPTIRNYRKVVADIKNHFEGYTYSFFISEYSGHLLTLAAKAVDEGYTHAVAVGGDGTLNEMVNGILKSAESGDTYAWEKISQIKIGILPSGSGNDFIKNLGYKTLSELKALIQKDQGEMVDVGYAEYLDRNMQQARRFFINVADVGIGGEVVLTKEKLPHLFSGSFNYFLAIVIAFLRYRKKRIAVKAKEFGTQGKVLNFVVANGKFFGNAIGIAPHAEISDGTFGITNIGDISLIDYFRNIGTAKKCLKINHPEVEYKASRELLIESLEDLPLTIDMDGEFIGYTPVHFTCLKGKLCFLKS